MLLQFVAGRGVEHHDPAHVISTHRDRDLVTQRREPRRFDRVRPLPAHQFLGDELTGLCVVDHQLTTHRARITGEVSPTVAENGSARFQQIVVPGLKELLA